jgi:hypothetical protein
MSGQEVEAREVATAEIKSVLRELSKEIPPDVWAASFPDSEITLWSFLDSSYLPKGPYGHDEIETVLTPDGRILEKLVHYDSDENDAEKDAPDEMLGETSDERYQELELLAISRLEWLKQQAA